MAVVYALVIIVLGTFKVSLVSARANLNHVHIFAHRSCSQDIHAPCQTSYEDFPRQLRSLEWSADQAGIPKKNQHLFLKLPEEIYVNKTWERHVQPGVKSRGHWFWKSAIVRWLMKSGKFQEGDIVFYVDGDHWDFLGSFFLDEHDGGFLSALGVVGEKRVCDVIGALRSDATCESILTKGDVFRRFNVSLEDPEFVFTEQFFSTFLAFVVNDATRELYRQWEQLAADFDLIAWGTRSKDGPDPPDLSTSQADQSLLSMIFKASQKKTSGKVHVGTVVRNCDVNAQVVPAGRVLVPEVEAKTSGSCHSSDDSGTCEVVEAKMSPSYVSDFGVKGLTVCSYMPTVMYR